MTHLAKRVIFPGKYEESMRKLTGKRLDLKHHPFPFGEKDKKEYVIGEALLRWKGISEEEVATLKNVKHDPPDLIFEAADFGEVRIEITEFVPYDRGSQARSVSFLNKLKAELQTRNTHPARSSNIFVSLEPGEGFPSMKSAEIKSIADKIDEFFRSKDFEARYEVIHTIIDCPIKIIFIPALGTWARPQKFYDNNLFLQDISGCPIDKKVFEHTFEDRIEKKRSTAAASDILVMFHSTIGIVGLTEDLLKQAAESMKSTLDYQGMYIVEIISQDPSYWVHVITIREHPLFAPTRHGRF